MLSKALIISSLVWCVSSESVLIIGGEVDSILHPSIAQVQLDLNCIAKVVVIMFRCWFLENEAHCPLFRLKATVPVDCLILVYLICPTQTGKKQHLD